jgi:hypothetical protein
MMSQFALQFPNNFHQCIAVSATGDPTGAWYLYDFQTSTINMNDYPHFGVWPDGYYMTVNQFNGSTEAWAGVGVAAFERSQMLQGLPARMIYINTGAVTTDYGGMLPSDLDGPAPAVGTPNYFMEWDDSSWITGDTSDNLRIWAFHVDWANTANSTFGTGVNYTPNYKLATTNVDPVISCGTSGRACISQLGTTAKLDAILDRLMYRMQYRNFGTYSTLLSITPWMRRPTELVFTGSNCGTAAVAGAFTSKAYTRLIPAAAGWGPRQWMMPATWRWAILFPAAPCILPSAIRAA